MEKLYPLCLCGVTKSPIWGGTRLLKAWGKQSDNATVGESWELCVRKNEVCHVTNGALAGKTLGELITQYGSDLTGADYGVEAFPLLVKLIDACDDLSVQVHPDDDYAKAVENDMGKTEMWYVLEAEEGSELISGLADGVGSAEFAKSVADGSLGDALKRCRVKPGDVFFIPSGLPHAIGKGILIAEIQQNSDLTYRVYDYDRRQPDGTLRELHVQKALDVIRPFSEAEINAIRYSRSGGKAVRESVLADCRYFFVERLTAASEAREMPESGTMRHLLCIAGEVTLLCDGVAYEVKKGDSWLLPAALESVSFQGNGTLLLSHD